MSFSFSEWVVVGERRRVRSVSERIECSCLVVAMIGEVKTTTQLLLRME